MSHFEELCECSKPDSQKRCRVSCGLPRYPDKRPPFRISPNEELSEQQWERIQNIIRKHKGEG